MSRHEEVGGGPTSSWTTRVFPRTGRCTIPSSSRKRPLPWASVDARSPTPHAWHCVTSANAHEAPRDFHVVERSPMALPAPLSDTPARALRTLMTVGSTTRPELSEALAVTKQTSRAR